MKPRTPLAPGQRTTQAERTAWATHLAGRYAKGVSVRDLATETGRSYGFVHRLLLEHGVTLRARGGAKKAGTK